MDGAHPSECTLAGTQSHRGAQELLHDLLHLHVRLHKSHVLDEIRPVRNDCSLHVLGSHVVLCGNLRVEHGLRYNADGLCVVICFVLELLEELDKALQLLQHERVDLNNQLRRDFLGPLRDRGLATLRLWRAHDLGHCQHELGVVAVTLQYPVKVLWREAPLFQRVSRLRLLDSLIDLLEAEAVLGHFLDERLHVRLHDLLHARDVLQDLQHLLLGELAWLHLPLLLVSRLEHDLFALRVIPQQVVQNRRHPCRAACSQEQLLPSHLSTPVVLKGLTRSLTGGGWGEPETA
mmetsp:Transcript_119631/g.333859  ORF Transcript_119631/g.333859 Transcript_119631/m.333859 type:complete len:291 (-) Transcript_119631:2-874(-)